MELFGSSANGFGHDTSDLDLCLIINDVEVNLILFLDVLLCFNSVTLSLSFIPLRRSFYEIMEDALVIKKIISSDPLKYWN